MVRAHIKLFVALAAVLGSCAYVVAALFDQQLALEVGIGYIVVVLSAPLIVRALR